MSSFTATGIVAGKTPPLAWLKKKIAAGEDPNELPSRGRVQLGPMNTRILLGLEDVTQWDDEEIERGMRRDINGRFQGRRPELVPRTVHEELVRRQMLNAQRHLQQNLQRAAELITAIIEDETVDPRERLKAAQMLMDRVMGKAPERVDLTLTQKPWMVALEGGIVNAPEEDYEFADVIDGEEDDDDE